MNNVSNDQELIKLLTSLKNAENNYPADLLQSRREMFAKQAASAAIAMNAAEKLSNVNSAGNQASSASSASSVASSSIATLLETILIAVIVVQVGVAAYLFRDKIADLINTVFSTRVEQVSNPPDQPASPSDILITEGAIITETPVSTITDTPVPMGTYSITTPQDDNNAGSGNGGSAPAISTPEPTKPGLHLGQTPKPNRTQPVPDGNNNKSEKKGKDK